MHKWQRIAGCFILAYGAIFVGLSLKASLGSPGEPGPGFMGFILGLALICCSVAFIFTQGGRGAKEGPENVPLWKGLGWVKPLGAVGALIAMVALLGVLGMIVSSLLFFVFWERILEGKGMVTAGLVAVLGTAAFYALFHILLRVQLPTGLLAG